MWAILRDRRLEGIKFRRQAPIGIYVADFYNHPLKFVIELDGEVHDDPRQAAHDENRDFYLRSLGCTVLRFPNRDVFENREAVLTRILEVAAHLQSPPIGKLLHPSPPSPSGRGAGGEASEGRML